MSSPRWLVGVPLNRCLLLKKTRMMRSLSLNINVFWLALLGAYLATSILPRDVSAFVLQPPQTFIKQEQRLSSTSCSLASTPVQIQEQDFWQRSEAQEVTKHPEIVYILLYNPGTAEEGVHTTAMDDEQGEVLWAFADIDDCMQFATLLKETEPPPEFNMALYPEPIPTPTPLSQMEIASREMGLVLRIVPATT